MQQRRVRLGDILDDYCPRERRITNHAIVAMIDDEVKQTRCTTCDSDHEYKQARVPPPRRKKESLASPTPTDMADHEQQEQPEEAPFTELPVEAVAAEEHVETAEMPAHEDAALTENREDEGPVHRRLIRATLPRPEGQPPERKGPELTMRQPGGGNPRHGRGRRGARGPQGSFNGPMRFGSGAHQNQSQPRHRQSGDRPGPSGNQRGGRSQGQQRGPGRKRGR
jgi:hypothetical protein